MNNCFHIALIFIESYNRKSKKLLAFLNEAYSAVFNYRRVESHGMEKGYQRFFLKFLKWRQDGRGAGVKKIGIVEI